VSGEHPEARGEAARARERFTGAGLAPRVAEVDAWLQAHPEEPARPSRRPARRSR
jgi:eukaryotic-like serine/threonine-protein kinase